MTVRSLIALFLLINYLLVAGAGCVSRPEEQGGLLLVQTSTEGQSYQECRYMRMDGLENFLTEALTARIQKSSETPKHHLISVVSSVDAHCLPHTTEPVFRVAYRAVTFGIGNRTLSVADLQRTIYTPPWLG